MAGGCQRGVDMGVAGRPEADVMPVLTSADCHQRRFTTQRTNGGRKHDERWGLLTDSRTPCWRGWACEQHGCALRWSRRTEIGVLERPCCNKTAYRRHRIISHNSQSIKSPKWLRTDSVSTLSCRWSISGIARSHDF